MQSISYRNAMFKPIMADRPGFRMEEIMCDIVHPNALGHRSAHTAIASPSGIPPVEFASLGACPMTLCVASCLVSTNRALPHLTHTIIIL